MVAHLVQQRAEVRGEASGAGQFAIQEVENEGGDEQHERETWERERSGLL